MKKRKQNTTSGRYSLSADVREAILAAARMNEPTASIARRLGVPYVSVYSAIKSAGLRPVRLQDGSPAGKGRQPNADGLYSCNVCHIPQPRSAFYETKRDGLMYRCKRCSSEVAKARKRAQRAARPPAPPKPEKPIAPLKIHDIHARNRKILAARARGESVHTLAEQYGVTVWAIYQMEYRHRIRGNRGVLTLRDQLERALADLEAANTEIERLTAELQTWIDMSDWIAA